MVGGGGGGGGLNSGGTIPSGGGAAGGYAEFNFSGIAASTTLSPTIGAAGTGGVAGGAASTPGGASSLALTALGVTVTCNGGSNSPNNLNAATVPQLGGTVTVTGSNAAFQALVTLQGDGSTGVSTWNSAGNMPDGASSPFGAAGKAGTSTANAIAATGHGSGGAGQLNPGSNGYPGTGGYLIIERIAG
jgi:hypothetical protein